MAAPAPPPQRGPLDELTDWFSSIPPVTRALFTTSLGISIAAGVGIISPSYLYLAWPLVYRKFEIWRLITSFFWMPVGFPYLTTLYFLYNYSWQLETTLFSNRRSDYVFYLIFTFIAILPPAIILKRFILLETLVVALLYVWAMANKHTEVSFFFGLRFKAMYLPWVWLVFDFLSGSTDPTGKLIGIAVGHLYYFLDKIYPEQNGGRKLLVTPQFLVNYFQDAPGGGPGGAGGGFGGAGRAAGGGGRPAPTGGSGYTAFRPRPTAEQELQEGTRQRAGYAWGRGHRLSD
ncbi:derlin-1-like protein [Zopfochytrium polystomum]|nr:derlin-1-like protein [Zopfochytrium polystomum]